MIRSLHVVERLHRIKSINPKRVLVAEDVISPRMKIFVV